MGLDSVELILDIEDRFGVQIADEAASKTETVGDLCDMVIALVAGPADRCLSQAVFHRVRDAMMDVLGIERRRVMPSMRLDEALPEQQRKLGWTQLAAATGYR